MVEVGILSMIWKEVANFQSKLLALRPLRSRRIQTTGLESQRDMREVCCLKLKLLF